jgi:ribonuclease P protein component
VTTSEPCISLSLTKSGRLLNSSDFSRVFEHPPIKSSHAQFLILATPNTLSAPRLGLIIAKKNVRLAVNRNRLKRLIRETFRHKQHNLNAIDAIVLARRGTEDLTNSELIEILNDLWKRVAKKATKLAVKNTTPC